MEIKTEPNKADEYDDNEGLIMPNRCGTGFDVRTGDIVKIGCHWGNTHEGRVIWRGSEFIVICTNENKKVPIPWRVIDFVSTRDRLEGVESNNDDIVIVSDYQEAIKLGWTMLVSITREGNRQGEAYVFCKQSKFVLIGAQGNNCCEFIQFISRRELDIRIKELKKI